MEKPKIIIESIKVVARPDYNADASYLGDYTDTESDWAICRCCGEYLANCDEDHELSFDRREVRFFKPYSCGEKEGTAEYQEYGKYDYERMERLNNGDWNYLGIQAVAIVKYSIGQGHFRLEEMTSGGLWGIESDSGEYLDEVMGTELGELKEHLEVFNVDMGNWDALTKDLELVYE